MAPGEAQGMSWMPIAAKISSRRLGDPGRAWCSPETAVEDTGEGPGEPRMHVEARSTSWRLGEAGRARGARSLAEGPMEGHLSFFLDTFCP